MHQPLACHKCPSLYICIYSVSQTSPSPHLFFPILLVYISVIPQASRKTHLRPSVKVTISLDTPSTKPWQSGTTSVLSFPPSYKPSRLPHLWLILSSFSPSITRSLEARLQKPPNESAGRNSPGLSRWNSPMWRPVLIKPNEASLHASYKGITISLYLYDDGVLL